MTAAIDRCIHPRRILADVVSFLLSVTFACGVIIAVAHVINVRFIAPVYDVVANLVAFVSAVAASVMLGHWVPAGLSSLAIVCWLVLARRTFRAVRGGVRVASHDDAVAARSVGTSYESAARATDPDDVRSSEPERAR